VSGQRVVDQSDGSARLPLVALDLLPDELRAAIERGLASRMLSTSRPIQVWAHRPKVALAWLALMASLHEDSLLDERLRELVRLKIASLTQCQACQLARKSEQVDERDIACIATDSEHFTPAERAALFFRYCTDCRAEPLLRPDAGGRAYDLRTAGVLNSEMQSNESDTQIMFR
jgi:hypothetical protein